MPVHKCVYSCTSVDVSTYLGMCLCVCLCASVVMSFEVQGCVSISESVCVFVYISVYGCYICVWERLYIRVSLWMLM